MHWQQHFPAGMAGKQNIVTLTKGYKLFSLLTQISFEYNNTI